MASRWPVNPALALLAFSLGAVAMVYAPGLGVEINGARRWVRLGPVMFQPSELVKWTLLLALAWWCARRSGVMPRFFVGLLPGLLLVGVAAAAIVVEDLGTAALICLVGMFVLAAGGARLWQMALLTPPFILAGVYAIVSSPYRVNRLLIFLRPYDDPEGKGYQPIQSMIALAQGGVWGQGIGNGVQKHGYLPQDTSDFILGIVCAETGFAGAALIVTLYLTLLWTSLAVARDCRDAFGRLLALGVAATVGVQAALNIAVVTVLVPTKGIALPLLSAGGTGWIMTAAALGMVASLDRAHQHAELDGEENLTESAGEAMGGPGLAPTVG
jgi:cell division protein FtsW